MSLLLKIADYLVVFIYKPIPYFGDRSIEDIPVRVILRWMKVPKGWNKF